MTLPRTGARVELDVSAFTSAVSALIQSSQQADDAINNIINSTNLLNATLGGVGGSEVIDISTKVDETALTGLKTELTTLDTTPTTADIDVKGNRGNELVIDTLEGNLETIDEGATAELTAEADETSIDTATKAFDAIADEPVEVTAEATDIDAVTKEFDAIADEPVEVQAEADEGSIDTAAKAITDKIPPETETKVEAKDDTSATLNQIASNLQTLKNAAIIDMIFKGLDVFNEFYDKFKNMPGVGAITELEDATAALGAHLKPEVWDTYKERATADIEDIFVNSDSATRDMIGQQIELAAQLGINTTNFKEAASASLDFADTFDTDPEQTLKTMNQLVESGLVPNLTAAGDLMAAGFQAGADRGGDLLSTLENNARTIKDLGLNGQEAMNLINSGLQSGFTSAGDVLNNVKLLTSNLQDPSNAKAMAALNQIGLGSAKDRAKMSGAELLDAVIAGIKESPAGKQVNLIGDLFGGKATKGGISAILGLDASTNTLGDTIEGRAQTAADTIDNTISSSIAKLQHVIDDFFLKFLSSAQIDLPGKLEVLKTQIQTFIDEMTKGNTLGGSLEVALQMPGLEDTINKFSGTLGNVFLDFQETIAKVLDMLGKGDAANGIREGIKGQAKTQMQFDLQVADDAPGITAAIKRAVERGVSSDDAKAGITTALNEMLGKGDLKGAQGVIDSIDAVFNSPGALKLHDFTVDKGGVDNAKEALAKMWAVGGDKAIQDAFGMTFEEAMSNISTAGVSFDTSEMHDKLDALAVNIQSQLTAALTSGDFNLAKELLTKQGIDPKMFDTIITPFKAAFDAAMTQKDIVPTASGKPGGMIDPDAVTTNTTAVKEMNAAVTGADVPPQTGAGTALEKTAQTSTTVTTQVKKDSASIGKDSQAAAAQVDTAKDTVHTATGGIQDDFNALGAASKALTDDMQLQWVTLGQVINAVISGMGDQAAVVSGIVDAAKNKAGEAPTGGGTGGGTTTEHAAGGTFSGASRVGEHGMELIQTGTAMSVLNNETSERLMSGLAAFFGAGQSNMSQVTNQRTVNAPIVINTQSSAQDMNALLSTSRAIRGF